MTKDLLSEAKARIVTRADRLLPRAANLALASTLVLAIAGAFVPLDVSVSGSGELFGGAPPATLTAPFGGVVAEVLQEPRRRFSAGEKMAVIKPASGMEAKQELDAQLALAEAKQFELETALMAVEGLMLGRQPVDRFDAAGMRAAVSQFVSLQSRANAAGRSRATAERRLNLAQQSRNATDALVARKRELVNRGVLPRSSAFDLDAQELEAEQRVESAQNDLDLALANQEDARSQISNLLFQQRAQFIEESRLNKARISELKASIAAASQLLEQSVIRTPVGGYVEAVEPVFVGRSVTVGEPLYNVTPNSLDHTLKVLVPNSAVAQISLGDPVRVRIEALNRSTIDYLNGEVIRVAEEPEPMPPAMLMLPSAARRPPEYTVEVKLTGVPIDKALMLRSGMRAQANIIVSKRAALIYILSPLMDRLKPFGEP